jgi:hypothetical protein
MNTNKTLIISIAGGSFVMVILGLIIYNVSGNTGDGKGISQVSNIEKKIDPNDNPYNMNYSDYEEVESNKEKKNIKKNTQDHSDLDNQIFPGMDGGRTRTRTRTKRIKKINRTKNKKRKHKTTKYLK